MSVALPPGTPAYIGPVVATGLSQMFLQGLLFAQASTYFFSEGCERDGWSMRLYVAGVIMLATAQTIERTVHLWYVTVLNYPWWDYVVGWPDPVMNTLLAVSVQSYMIYRCWKFSRRKVLVVTPMVIPLLFEFGSGVSHGIYTMGTNTNPVAITFLVWLYASLVLDFFLTTTLLAHLWHERTGVAHLDATLRTVMQLTLESAAPALLCAAAALATYYTTITTSSTTALFTVSAGKLYCHALLMTLNSRDKLRERMAGHGLGRQSLHESAFTRSLAPSAPVFTHADALESGSRIGDKADDTMRSASPDTADVQPPPSAVHSEPHLVYEGVRPRDPVHLGAWSTPASISHRMVSWRTRLPSEVRQTLPPG